MDLSQTLIRNLHDGCDDTFGVFRNPQDNHLYLLMMHHLLPITKLYFRFTKDDGNVIEASEMDLQWQVVLDIKPNKTPHQAVIDGARISILDDRQREILSSDRDFFRGQILVITESPSQSLLALHAIYDLRQEKRCSSLQTDSSRPLAYHWLLTATVLH